MTVRAGRELACALAFAAAEQPGAVRDLAQRAQVGYAAARCTASRMVDRGELMVLEDGRPAVLALAPGGESLAAALDRLHRSHLDCLAIDD